MEANDSSKQAKKMTYTETAYNLSHFATDPLEERKGLPEDDEDEGVPIDTSSLPGPQGEQIAQIVCERCCNIKNLDICVICQYKFNPRAEAEVFLLPCGHVLHKHCGT